jgi:hypothetical protein
MVRITTGYGLHMNLIWICVFDDAYISTERTIFVYIINSSNRYGRNLAEEKPYSQMVL